MGIGGGMEAGAVAGGAGVVEFDVSGVELGGDGPVFGEDGEWGWLGGAGESEVEKGSGATVIGSHSPGGLLTTSAGCRCRHCTP